MNKELRWVLLKELYHSLWISADFEADFQAAFPDVHQNLFIGQEWEVSDERLAQAALFADDWRWG